MLKNVSIIDMMTARTLSEKQMQDPSETRLATPLGVEVSVHAVRSDRPSRTRGERVQIYPLFWEAKK